MKNKSVQDSAVTLLCGAALAFYSLYRFYTAKVQTGWIMSPYLFPLLISVFALALAVSLFFEGRFEVRSAREQAEPAAETGPKINLGRAAVLVLICIAYFVLVSYIKFIPSTILFLAGLTWYLGERRKLVLILVPLITPFVLYVIFDVLLNVRLP